MFSFAFHKDLMLFCEDDPKPVLPIIPTSIVSSMARLSEGQTDVYNLWDTGKLKNKNCTQKRE